jgi:hypothetical protein
VKKTVSLKELPGAYVPSSLTLVGLCEFLKISEQHIKKWEEFFGLSPELQKGTESVYSKDVVKKFIKIKEYYDKGRPLKELKDKISGKVASMPVVPMAPTSPLAPAEPVEQAASAKPLAPIVKTEAATSAKPVVAIAPMELEINPFEKSLLSTKKMPEFKIPRAKEEETAAEMPSSSALVRPFLTQLNKVNLKMEKLLNEKTKLIENTAIEKSRLITKIEVLKAQNANLEREKDLLAISLQEKEQEVKKHFSQETVLGETLMITQEIFRKKEDEIRQLNGKIEKYEREIARKNKLIQKQSAEIGEMLEKQNNKWWKFWVKK